MSADKRQRFRAYTSRRMPADLLDRVRLLAATQTAVSGKRATMESVMAEVIRRGLPLVEREVLK